MNVAFGKETLDFKFFEEALTKTQKKMRQDAIKAAEKIKTGQYEHASVQVDLAMNAPLFIIPAEFFSLEDYIKLDTGVITVKSHLVPYDQSLNYRDCKDED